MRRRGPAYALVPVVAVMTLVGPVWAQSPTADQIIRALTPTDPPRITRGIRVLEPEPNGSTADQVHANTPGTDTPGHANPVQRPAVSLTVNFVSGSADLNPSAIRTLDELGQALTSKNLTVYRFRIEGHTDTVGMPEMNKALSSRRAATVLDYLAVKWKVDRAKLEAVGMGQEQLAVPTGPNVAQPRNRRVTVINLGA